MDAARKPCVSIQYGNDYGSSGETFSINDPSHMQLERPQPSTLVSSPSANFARLSMLVVDCGTEATAFRVKQVLPDSQSLDETLCMHYGHLIRLLKDKVINQGQMEVLFPPDGLPVNENDIDLTLWVVLLRNITNKKIKWVDEPQPWHRNFWHDIQRLKIIRNRLAHIRKAELSNQSFVALWEETATVLMRLGMSKRQIQSYQERDLEPEKARRAVQEVKSQVLDDVSAHFEQMKGQNSKLKIFLLLVCILVIVSVIASVVVALKLKNPWQSCAKNIEYAKTEEALVSYISPAGWGARQPRHMNPLNTPVSYVIISHSAQVTTPCYTTDECCMTVRVLQDYHMDENKWSDIAWNYVIGSDGVVFIGRGPKYAGSAALHWNARSISIGFIGLFTRRPPTEEALDALTVYLDYLVESGVVAPNYTLYGLCQVRKIFPDAPGAAFLKEIKKMFPDHWKNDNITDCNFYE